MTPVVFSAKRTGLQALIVSVVVSAALGIYALVQGDFGETDGRILLTALAVAAASVLTLGAGIALERGRPALLPYMAIVITVSGFGLLIVTIWRDFEPDPLLKTAASAIFAGAALTQWSLVGLARLPARFRGVQIAAYPLSGAMAAFLAGAVWGGWGGSGSAQFGGVVGILTVAVTIIVPVLQRITTSDDLGLTEVRYCPYCGEPLHMPHGSVTCPSCGAGFRISPA